MKKLTIVAVLALSASNAWALDTVMGLKGRFDYIHTETDTKPGAETSSGVLTTSFLRLVTDAKLNETTTAKLTLDFQPDGTSDNGLSNLVDEAYLSKNIMGLSFLVGKQAIMTGGRENDYSSRDVYITSKFNDQINDNLMGISAGYSMAGQNVYLQYLQQSQTQGTIPQAPLTDKKVVGVAYYGELMNKMIMPIVSFHKQGTTRVGAYDNLAAVGLRVNVAAFMVEADYLMLEQEKLAANTDAKLKSMVAHVRYFYEGFQPFAKYIFEKGKDGFQGLMPAGSGANESERNAWEVGLEYVPNKDEDFRYHVVYNNSEAKMKTPTLGKVEEQKIYAGIAFNYNILK